MKALARQSGVSAEKPFAELPQKAQDAFFYGSKERLALRYGAYEYKAEWKGAVTYLSSRAERDEERKRHLCIRSAHIARRLPRMQRAAASACIACRPSCRADYRRLHGTCRLQDAVASFNRVKLSDREEKIAGLILREIRQRLGFLDTVGLGYLTLDRASSTLSGGEGQRIRLATQIGSQFAACCTFSTSRRSDLHPRDNLKLLDTLEHLRDLGNTVLVVEHDEETIRRADHVVDLGPGAGAHGGEIVAQGTPEEIAASARLAHGPLHFRRACESGSGRAPPVKRQSHQSRRRAREQSEEHRRNLSARPVHRRDRRVRLRQINAR